MAVYKLFAEKDATIYSEYNSKNTGMDSILELTKEESVLYAGSSTVSRFLIQFNQSDITNIVTSYIGTGSFKAYLKLYLADASSLPTNFSVVAHPSYDSWIMGTGKYGNIPITTDGCSWKYKGANSGSGWSLDAMPGGVTGSYSGSNVGGGTWYQTPYATQSISQYTKKDLELDVTQIVLGHYSGTFNNNGIIVKNSGSIEFDVDYLYKLTYFSRDTNTIYPPVLEFRWDDASYQTGSLVTSENLYLSIKNNYVTFNEKSIQRFRVNAREQYPARTFSTSSIYTTTKLLPSSSYYCIKDAKNNEVIVDFDDHYTKISSDSNGNYFDVYMNGLEPERYYRILVKTIINGNTIILDDQYFFKVEQ